MKKIFVSCFFIVAFGLYGSSQTYTATVGIGEVNVAKLKPGDDVIVPVKLIEKSEGLIAVFQLFINFDHSLFSWKGTWEQPLTGIRNFHQKMPYSQASWLFNDNGNQMVAIWDDPAFDGIEMANGDIFFEIIFTYKGGLTPGNQSALTWGDVYEDIDGRLVRGKTEIYEFSGENFILTTVSGAIIN